MHDKIAVLKYFLKPQTFDEYPVNWKDIFGNRKKLYVEIGFGSGEYMAALAKENPDINFVGFETSLTALYKAQINFYKNNIKNARVIQGDARLLIRELFPSGSISKLIVNFPCPWPKKRHKERRIFIESFILTLADVLRKGGTIELATDVDWYAQEVYDNFSKSEFFEAQEIIENFNRPIKTKYELKWDKEGRNKYLFIAKKVKDYKVLRILEGVSEMPHKNINSIDIDKLKDLKDKKFQEGNKTFVVNNVYEDMINDRYLLKVVSSDDDFIQQYYVAIYKKTNSWLVKLDSVTIPYRTPAVKFSVYKIAELIEEI
ncbi:tRNA (guanine-N(7)-)-methyltransferase [Marinitoga piezophila KA3]|uniref:tRNA (guanine-N(7)-)-methyltransferase n=1 Tax=Marinitoga piezophila (strain DSM 14283 / JCM 11233 / KA3) TaxID=443254 RepID=H2J304_MARPK|nr:MULTISPECIES: tRNA (guanosine(46)-N7)-methyltransferase TrmB [Marinitoga]AEX85695.1 tRNA (guanine-N(7)-)-methyltransferase [Marinitoga piezophila KA3]